MSYYKLLKHAASYLEAAASELEGAHKKVAAAQAAVPAQQKVAAATAAADEGKKAQRTQLAKLAADKLMQAGLLSTSEKRDQFVVDVLDHDQALTKIAKLAEHVKAPKLGKVVANPDGPVQETAEANWDKQASAVLSRLNIR